MLTYEEACYFENMLLLGFSEGYDAWFDQTLATEDPLSDLMLALTFCADNRAVISVLHNYYLDKPIDDVAVYEKFRTYFRQAYYSGKMNEEEIVTASYRISVSLQTLGPNFDFDLLSNLNMIEECYSMAQDGIITRERFNTAFDAFLNKSAPRSWATILDALP